MGEGGAAPVHTMSAAIQDALYAQGIIINDSYNNGEGLYRALVAKERCQAKDLVRTEKRK
jgi:hypothetical protein